MPLSRIAAVAGVGVIVSMGSVGLVTIAAMGAPASTPPPSCASSGPGYGPPEAPSPSAGVTSSTICETPSAIGSPIVSDGWANPLAPARYTMTSPFGAWRPFLVTAKLHIGQDLAAPVGTPVLAVCDAVVMGIGWDAYGGGNMTTLDCGGGVTVKLMHQSAFFTEAGVIVRAGQKIGSVGSSGNSSGPHLHVQVEVRGVPVDPVPFLNARRVTL